MSAYHGNQQVDINAQDGSKGKAGESGGNFTLISNSFTNINWLKVKLNGGHGGKGQDGGSGLVGNGGYIGNEMPIHLMLTTLPSPVKNDELESELALKAA